MRLALQKALQISALAVKTDWDSIAEQGLGHGLMQGCAHWFLNKINALREEAMPL